MEVIQTLDGILLFIKIILPGIISAKFFALINPVNNKIENAKELIYEVIAFGAINFLIYLIFLKDYFAGLEVKQMEYFLFIVGYIFILPIVIAVLLKYVLIGFEKLCIINNQSKTAWDDCFRRVFKFKTCWVIIELKNGEFIGGQVSYVSQYPNFGHIHIYNLYNVDKSGYVLTSKKIINNKLQYGLILRPEDYNTLKIITKN